MASTLFGPDPEIRDGLAISVSVTAVASDAGGNFVVTGQTPVSGFPVLGGFQMDDRRKSLFQRPGGSEAWIAADDNSHKTIRSIEIDAQNPGRIFLAGDTGIFKSDDSGQTWQRLSDRPTRTLRVHPLNSDYQVRIIYRFN
jgi:hypothetical protein